MRPTRSAVLVGSGALFGVWDASSASVAAYAVTARGAAQPAEKLSTTMTTDPDGKPYTHSEEQSEAAKLSLTPRTDRRCEESQSLQTMAMRFAWMCDHARRLERETNCLRGTLRLVAKHADFSQCPPEVEPAVDAALLPPNNVLASTELSNTRKP